MTLSNRQRGYVTLSVKVPADLHTAFEGFYAAYSKYGRISKSDILTEALIDWIAKAEQEAGEDFFKKGMELAKRGMTWGKLDRERTKRFREICRQQYTPEVVENEEDQGEIVE